MQPGQPCSTFHEAEPGPSTGSSPRSLSVPGISFIFPQLISFCYQGLGISRLTASPAVRGSFFPHVSPSHRDICSDQFVCGTERKEGGLSVL